MFNLIDCVKGAKLASKELNNLTEDKISGILIKVANALRQNASLLKGENEKDIVTAKNNGKSDAFIDRLMLTDGVIEGMAVGIEQVADLKSPRGQTVYTYTNEFQGIDIKEITVPFGVIGIIYESRPNVTADAFALCFKTANAVVLKGGSDAIYSNTAIVNIIRQTLENEGINKNAVSLIEDTSRETTAKFMKLKEYIDVLIPRGSGSLINYALENSTIPIIETGKGNCNIYIDEFADLEKAVKIVFNAKTQRYSVCNACESLVIHSNVLSNALPLIANSLKEKQVEIRADERSYEIIKDYPFIKRATEEDFYEEYDSAIISVKTVDSVEEAISCINEYSTSHSESIVTENVDNAEKFLKDIDSACVYHNASTRFSDGFVFGKGAEIGISTQKLHARGPMGLEALVTKKYIVKGNGAVRK